MQGMTGTPSGPFMGRPSRRVTTEWASRQAAGGRYLSFDQERRLLTEEWARRHSYPYLQSHLVAAFALSRNVEISAVQRALDLIVSRHSALRAVFEPVTTLSAAERERLLGQAFHSSVSTSGLHNLTFLERASAKLTERRVAAICSSPLTGPLLEVVLAEAVEPFALTAPPLARALILEDVTGHKLLVITADRLVVDWWSMALIRLELERSRWTQVAESSDDPGAAGWRLRRLLKRRSRASTLYWWDHWSKLNLVPLACDDFAFALPGTNVLAPSFGWQVISLSPQVVTRLREVAGAIGETLDLLLFSPDNSREA
jgi:hypothetical protein